MKPHVLAVQESTVIGSIFDRGFSSYPCAPGMTSELKPQAPYCNVVGIKRLSFKCTWAADVNAHTRTLASCHVNKITYLLELHTPRSPDVGYL